MCKVMTPRQKFLETEYNNWAYWQQFPFTEFIDVMDCDVAQCECGEYYWKHHKKHYHRRCGCK